MAELTDTKITLDTVPEEPLLHNLDSSKKFMRKKVISISLVIIAGIASGYLLFSLFAGGYSLIPGGRNEGSPVQVVGSTDTKVFRDSAQGKLEEGGINGEGTHSLIRPGGDNQTVYLTSSVLILDDFVGKKVKVWGETFAGKKAGWLMDVGKVEVLE